MSLDKHVAIAISALSEQIEWHLGKGSFDDEFDGTIEPDDDIGDLVRYSNGIDFGDILHEAADGAVPIYNGELAGCLSDNPGISGNIEEHGFDSSGDMFQDIMLCVFLEIQERIGDHDFEELRPKFVARALKVIAKENEDA